MSAYDRPLSVATRIFATRMRQLELALEESVKLQSHYAKLLNMYDGGRRRAFKDGEEWIARLNETQRWDPEAGDPPEPIRG